MEIPKKLNGFLPYGLHPSPQVGSIGIDTSDNKLKVYNGSSWSATSTATPIAVTKYLLAQNIVSPTWTVGSWTNVPMNTLFNPGGIILNSGSFAGVGGSNTNIQLAAGTYIVEAQMALAHDNNNHRIRFRDNSNNITLVVGEARQSNTGANAGHDTTVSLLGNFTLTSTTNTSLQVIVSVAAASQQSNIATENYATIKLTKVA